MTLPAAFPFVEVRIDTSGLTPVAQRSPGVIAVVGRTPAGAAGGLAEANRPFLVETLDDAVSLFASRNSDGAVLHTPLSSSLELAMLQDPKPSRIYGVRVTATNYAAALSSLEAADDVTFVSLAAEPTVGAASTDTTPASGLVALREHVERMSSQGQKRLGVAMVDPAIAKSPTYAATVIGGAAALRSPSSRMVLVAARGAANDVATAAMAAMAGFAPHISLTLKRIRGVQSSRQVLRDGAMVTEIVGGLPPESQFSPSEIIQLSQAGINPIIDPALVVGTSLHFADGRVFTDDADLPFIDIVRVLDDIDFRLKAGLIGAVGDARITKSGLTMIKARVDGILGPLKLQNVIADYRIDILALEILNLPESSWTATDRAIIVEARANRTVDLLISVTYGPAVHRLRVTLAPKF
jgi:hypothetical protein